MDLKTYISDTEKRSSLAAACDTSADYLWQLANAWRGRKPSVDLAKKIEAATSGVVSRHDLRPDIFGPAPADTQSQAA